MLLLLPKLRVVSVVSGRVADLQLTHQLTHFWAVGNINQLLPVIWMFCSLAGGWTLIFCVPVSVSYPVDVLRTFQRRISAHAILDQLKGPNTSPDLGDVPGLLNLRIVEESMG
ncbi:hypothetical protein ACF1YV_000325 [Escherichia coli]|uniref:hypothetical protein n=1 Tax=Escherichia albertii TaxID=208962 RepID=UPI00178C6FEF|nr:hypothetical protein [Escherichia albertii]EJS0007640.1 hypothetical protein [Escherichia coli]HAL1644938.1 hypothetical protein [Escherichia coli]HCO2249435.1 hypothetical protein [Escherichia coli]HDI5049026.1 hypothetical protein [Escherichia coli]HDI5396038.1 hypothetical protein [Escherichia coli]